LLFEVLGVDVGDSEDETFWTAFLRSLRTRGLSGVRLVISDAHAGLTAAIRKCMTGASWQRCRVHYARNLLAVVPKGSQEIVAAAFRSIFALGTKAEVEARWDEVTDTLAERFPKAAESMRNARTDVLAFTAFPRAHWPKVWSNNRPEPHQGTPTRTPPLRGTHTMFSALGATRTPNLLIRSAASMVRAARPGPRLCCRERRYQRRRAARRPVRVARSGVVR